MLETIPADLYKPLLDEFRRGWLMEQVKGRVEAKQLSTKAKEYHRGVDGVGRLRARIPASSFHYWGQRLGYQCWSDENFLKKYLKENNLEVKGGKTKMMVGYGKSTTEGSMALLDQFGRPLSA
jgi:hypothetical protein